MRVAILTENLYEEMELWYPYYRLKEASADVVLVAPQAGETYTSKHGLPARSELAARAAHAADFDAVVIPGGYSPDHMRRNRDMVRFVREMDEAGKVVAAICHAGWMLASAKILSGRTMTSFFAIRDDMEHAGANWVDERVVVDGNLVTSRTPADLPAFLPAILKLLGLA